MESARAIVAVFGLLIAGLGLWGVASPAGVVAFARRWTNRHGLWLAAGLRVALGVTLWLAAPAARQPTAFQVLAVVSLVAGVVLPFMGIARLSGLVDWWAARPVAALRLWTAVAAAFGIYLIWATQA